MTRDWVVRHIEWCDGCEIREVNEGSAFCAHCEGILLALEAPWQS